MMIFDGHADLLYDVTKWRQAGEDRVFERRHLPRLQAGQIGGLGLSIWTTVEQDSIWSAHPDWDGWRRTEEMMACAREELAECPWLALVRTAAEARKAQTEGKLFAFLSVEGMEPVGDRLERLEQYAQWGVRMGMLTWNEENLLACGAGGDPDKGLTALGREAVRRIVIPEYPELHLSVSIGGVSGVHPLAEAIRQADYLMYENKEKYYTEGEHITPPPKMEENIKIRDK